MASEEDIRRMRKNAILARRDMTREQKINALVKYCKMSREAAAKLVDKK